MEKDRVSAFEDAVMRSLERNIEQFTPVEVEQIKSELVELRNNPNRLPDDNAMVLMGRAYMYDILERVSEDVLANIDRCRENTTKEGDVPSLLDRPFGEVLRERVDALPDAERTKLYEAIDSGEPSDEVLNLPVRIIFGIFKDAYKHSPEVFAEAMGWCESKTE
ncbi:MAG: hypothetical protein J6U93_05130 [Alistipes sp.]|nr:hypothetical protein [Alistipes sp.]